jgi:hypothetical protein
MAIDAGPALKHGGIHWTQRCILGALFLFLISMVLCLCQHITITPLPSSYLLTYPPPPVGPAFKQPSVTHPRRRRSPLTFREDPRRLPTPPHLLKKPEHVGFPLERPFFFFFYWGARHGDGAEGYTISQTVAPLTQMIHQLLSVHWPPFVFSNQSTSAIFKHFHSSAFDALLTCLQASSLTRFRASTTLY